MFKILLFSLHVITFQAYVNAAGPTAADTQAMSDESILEKEMGPQASSETVEPAGTEAKFKTFSGPMVKIEPDPNDDVSVPNAKRATAAEVKDNLAKLKESQIPVFSSNKVNKTTSGVSSGRMIMGLGVILVMSLGLIYFSRWYSRRNHKSTDASKIRVVSQHFLGPRKSVAIVRVAGESLLIGITDQNISMLKPLTMLEDEEAETGISSFKNTLMDSNRQIEEDFVTQSVVDRVSKTIKGMRSI